MKCPCCGQELPTKSSVDVDMATVNGIKVWPRVADLAHVLVANRGRIVLWDTIIRKVWGIDEPEHVEKCVHVYITRLRKAGLKIETIYKRGYRAI